MCSKLEFAYFQRKMQMQCRIQGGRRGNMPAVSRWHLQVSHRTFELPGMPHRLCLAGREHHKHCLCLQRRMARRQRRNLRCMRRRHLQVSHRTFKLPGMPQRLCLASREHHNHCLCLQRRMARRQRRNLRRMRRRHIQITTRKFGVRVMPNVLEFARGQRRANGLRVSVWHNRSPWRCVCEVCGGQVQDSYMRRRVLMHNMPNK